MGWSVERYRFSTFPELNLAISGYWRNWERNTAWLMREIVWSMIAGNPNIKFEDKPSNKQQIMKLRIDEVTDDKPKKVAINKLEKKLKS